MHTSAPSNGPAAAVLSPVTLQQPEAYTPSPNPPMPVHNFHPGIPASHYVCPLEVCFPAVIGAFTGARYRPVKAIGRGAFATVWKLQDVQTGEYVVGKLSDLAQMTPSNRAFALAEADTIRSCDHPNIIRLIETFQSNEKLLLILEYANGGDLLKQVEARALSSTSECVAGAQNGVASPVAAGVPGVPGQHYPQQQQVAPPAPCGALYKEEQALVIFAQLCLAIKYLHDKKIMHRDLKTPNVMLMRIGLIKLGDFGFSRQYEESVSADVGRTFCGTPYYLAPELWRRQAYSYKADIWSLGVIMYELLTLHKPFPAKDLNELMSMVLREDSFEPLPSQYYSPELIALVGSMLSVDPARRPSIRDILATPLMQRKGLRYLIVNVPRIKGLDPHLRQRIVEEAEKLIVE